MPTYRYRCNDCEIMFNVDQDRDANHDAAPCPRCEQPADRVWTVPVIVFKGDGFSLALQAEEVKEPQIEQHFADIEGLQNVGTMMGGE